MSIHEMPTATDSIIDTKNPLVLARTILAELGAGQPGDVVRCHHEDLFRWDHSKFIEFEGGAIRRHIYNWLETRSVLMKRGETESIEAVKPNKHLVDSIMDALKSDCHLDGRFAAPCWLDNLVKRPSPQELLVCKNGLVHLPAFVAGDADYLTPPTPLFFNHHAADFEFMPEAATPLLWLEFLKALWGADAESIHLLQQWMGYLLTVDTRQQKMMLLYGPKRSGKGTIARIITAMLGRFNVAGPTLGGLATNFGLWGLIGKPLAIISDARLSGRADQAIIVERLLSISGEDTLTVDRKNLDPVNVQLPTRIMVMTNELPRLADASGALASRFLILRLTRSFFGNEDHHLTEKLLAEMPGILLWAVDGWRQLREQGRFIMPVASEADVLELDELGSPVTAFVRERCTVRAAQSVGVDDLFKEWLQWCQEQGRDHPGTKPVFGRDLKAAYPAIRISQPRIGGERLRLYEGIGLGVDVGYGGES